MVLNETLSVIQILLQLAAAFFAFKIGKKINAARYWYAIVVAFILMALRRTTSLFITLGALPQLEGLIGIVDRVYLPLFISIFLIVGVYSLYKKLANE